MSIFKVAQIRPAKGGKAVVIVALIAIMISVQLAVLVRPHHVKATDNIETLQFTELGTHPQAAAMSQSWQKQITELALFKGKLLAGYGDYNSNIGPISINPFDIDSGDFEGEALNLQSESIGAWKEINGKLYAPTIDVRGCGNCASGYAVSDNGSDWEVKTPVTALHIFDVATFTGTDLWLLGSSGGGDGYATAWRSVDDGQNWTAIKTSSNSGSRYYWAKAINGKMYLQEYGTSNNGPMQIFDGTNWTTGTSTSACYGGDYSGGPNPVMFKNKMVCYWTDHLRTFDGQSVAFVDPEPMTLQINDPGVYLSYGMNNSTVATDTALYTLDFLQTFEVGLPERILRSPDLRRWQILEGLPTDTTAMTVDENDEKIYVGTADAKLYVADLPELSLPEIAEDLSGLNNGDANNDGVQDSTQDNVSVMSNSVSGKPVVLELGSNCDIEDADTEAESSSARDSGYDYPNALVNFTADCGASGATTSVKIFYYDVSNANFTLRKHNPQIAGYNVVSGAALSQQTIAGRTVTVASYSVTDGQELDVDGQANGIIVDPVGLAQSAVGAPNTGVGRLY